MSRRFTEGNIRDTPFLDLWKTGFGRFRQGRRDVAPASCSTCEHWDLCEGGGHLDLSPEAKAMLDRQIQWLKSAPPYAIILQGHCDERGSREYNLALGERRAQAVKIYMVSMGLAHDRIMVLSFGREQPVDAGHTQTAWARNRRVETVLEPLFRR